MQKPTRYYITKDGDEPTLRSVSVAVERVPREERGDMPAPATAEMAASRDVDPRGHGVTQLVAGAIKKRTVRMSAK